jgi:NAD(P)-dependent dehydrogenase (short-subunit alcohol dehydrogenase family)
MGKFKLTVDGLESQMATDHIGPFLLTKLIAPKLLATSTPSFTPRVVFVSSAAHAFGPGINLSNIAHPEPEKSSCANVLTAIELSKRAHGKIKAYSLHPGGAWLGRGPPLSRD